MFFSFISLNQIQVFFLFFSDLIQFVFVSLSRGLVSYYLETLVVIFSKGLSPPAVSVRMSLSSVPHQTHTM